MAFFKSLLCCPGDGEILASLDTLHSHGENYARYLELLDQKQDAEITKDLLKESSAEVATRFEQLSEKYLAVMQMNEKKMSEEVKGKIRTACGMSRLLVKEKISQFNQFVANYESQVDDDGGGIEVPPGTKVVKLDDLRSFFEIIKVQVSDLDSMFNDIHRLRNHGWKDVPELKVSDGENGFERKGSKMKLIIEAPAPTKNAQADLERREQKRAELRKIMRSQAASDKGDGDDITIAIFEGKKIE